MTTQYPTIPSMRFRAFKAPTKSLNMFHIEQTTAGLGCLMVMNLPACLPIEPTSKKQAEVNLNHNFLLGFSRPCCK